MVMIFRVPSSLGAALSLDSSTLTTSYTGGSVFSVGGASEVDFEIVSTFKSGTALTSISYEIQTCNTSTGNWLPIQSSRASTGDVYAEHSVSAAAGTTVRDRLRSTEHIAQQYVRIAAKCAGTAASGDIAAANLDIAE